MVKTARNNLTAVFVKRWLYISSSHERDLFLALIEDGSVKDFKIITGGGLTEKLLPNINAYFRHIKEDIDGIVLGSDKGISFSQERILISIINTLAFVWVVPVAATNQINNLGRLPKINKLSWSDSLTPQYRLG